MSKVFDRVRLHGSEAMKWAEAHSHTLHSFLDFVKNEHGIEVCVSTAREMPRENQDKLYVDVLAQKCGRCGLHYPAPTWAVSFAEVEEFHGCLGLERDRRISDLENRCLQLEHQIQEFLSILKEFLLRQETEEVTDMDM